MHRPSPARVHPRASPGLEHPGRFITPGHVRAAHLGPRDPDLAGRERVNTVAAPRPAWRSAQRCVGASGPGRAIRPRIVSLRRRAPRIGTLASTLARPGAPMHPKQESPGGRTRSFLLRFQPPWGDGAGRMSLPVEPVCTASAEAATAGYRLHCPTLHIARGVPRRAALECTRKSGEFLGNFRASRRACVLRIATMHDAMTWIHPHADRRCASPPTARPASRNGPRLR
jgi:hypothetical protein